MPALHPLQLPGALRPLTRPLTLAALFTLFAVALSLRWVEPERAPAAWALLAGFTVMFLAHDVVSLRSARMGHALLAVQALPALALIALSPRIGTAQVLLVIWSAAIVIAWPMRVALPAIAAVNACVYLIVQRAGHPSPLTVVLLYAGFQGFAALCAHYAASAERARDRLALVNADLLATRALLADSARDAERLRVARELHDVAGHKLTAMMLNLRALASDPAFAQRAEVQVSQQLAGELLGDIRDVVQALRDARGLDLSTALRALAAPLPRPVLRLDIAADVHIDDTRTAETVLRLVQEALTNSARHGDAAVLHVALRRDADRLVLEIGDDGRLRGPLREGNGLAGMRERVADAGGTFTAQASARGSLDIAVSLPL